MAQSRVWDKHVLQTEEPAPSLPDLGLLRMDKD